MSRLVGPIALGALVVGLTAACVPDPGRQDRTTADYLRILDAEDARPSDGPERTLLVSATELADPLLRRAAVRALGRLEDPELRDAIIARLDDPAPSVRAAAAMALAQSAQARDGEDVLGPLLARAPLENDPAVRGALARALGLLRLGADGRARALEAVLVLGRRLGSGPGGEPPPETLLGVALGIEGLVGATEAGGVGPEIAERLEELLAYRREAPGDVDAGRVRALALSALGRARRLSVDLVTRGLEDPDAEVRRAAVGNLGAVIPSGRAPLLQRALDDRADPVAIEAVRFLAARARTPESCRLLIARARPTASPAVRVEALEALAEPCSVEGQAQLLRETAAALDAEASWHAPVHALHALARIDPEGARTLLGPYVRHADPFVRAHAAAVAGALEERQTLGTLSTDVSANVRTAAVAGLFALEGHSIDALLRAHLESDDPQLVLTAARLLEGSPDVESSALAALAAFERISGTGRETLRDPRRVLLARVAELEGPTPVGGEAPPAMGAAAPELVERLRAYLTDYDPVVATDVAEILEAWTGQPQVAAPRRLARAPLPSVEELAALERTTVTLHIEGLGPIMIRLLPHSAVTNASRFVRLAASGYFDGLTFHRRASNFVIQGGSPGANEYSGDGPYTRDEIELPHWRGTVGLSTRGRDTGDGQIFINLVHNLRLDPDYTVFGLVTEGMEVADRVLEGAVIERAEVRVGG